MLDECDVRLGDLAFPQQTCQSRLQPLELAADRIAVRLTLRRLLGWLIERVVEQDVAVEAHVRMGRQRVIECSRREPGPVVETQTKRARRGIESIQTRFILR